MASKEQSKKDLIAAVEATRKQLRKPGDKLPITFYDYFILAVFISVMVGGHSYWLFLCAIVWERPLLLWRHGLLRMRQDRELKRSEKLMLEQIKNYEGDE